MTTIAVIMAMTVRQILSPTRLVLMGLATLAAPAIFFLASSDQIGQALTQSLSESTVAHFGLAIPVSTLVLAVSALGDERRDSTLSFIVLRPISRLTIAGSKISAALATALLLNGLGALALGILMGIRSDEWGYIVPLLTGTLVATALYNALFVPLGFLAERATLIGLFYAFIWEFGIASWLPGLTAMSVWRTGYAAFAGLLPKALVSPHPDTLLAPLGNMLAGAGGSLLKMFIATLLAALFTSWLLRTRDLV